MHLKSMTSRPKVRGKGSCTFRINRSDGISRPCGRAIVDLGDGKQLCAWHRQRYADVRKRS